MCMSMCMCMSMGSIHVQMCTRTRNACIHICVYIYTRVYTRNNKYAYDAYMHACMAVCYSHSWHHR